MFKHILYTLSFALVSVFSTPARAVIFLDEDGRDTRIEQYDSFLSTRIGRILRCDLGIENGKCKNDKGAYCTASLVGPNVIVTAAHCLTFGDAEHTDAPAWKDSAAAQFQLGFADGKMIDGAGYRP